MNGYLVSLLVGVAVGAAYGLLQVRSPAPPVIALIGLLGMVLGEQAVIAAKHHVLPANLPSIRQAFVGAQKAHLNPAKETLK
jgi:XapX domain-containing protein